jgi:hypothetical protein
MENKDIGSELSIECRIFLHLLEKNSFKDKMIVPDELTERGISNSLNCTLGWISRILKKNEEEGIIFRTKSKIVKNKKKQNVFFLTENGVGIAKEIRKIILESN